MIKLIKMQKIIITYHHKQKSPRTIAREVGLNRRTVARYIKDYERKRNQLLAADNSAKEELISDIVAPPIRR